MITIDNQDIVAIPELNVVISSCRSYRRPMDVLIQFKKNVQRFDIVFVAGLFLLHKMSGHKFKLDEHSAPILPGDYVFEFRQYLWDIHSIYGPDQDWLDFRIIKSFSEVDKNSSRAFAPILLIDESTLPQLFDRGSNSGVFSGIKARSLGSINESIKLARAKIEVGKLLGAASAISILVFEKLYLKSSSYIWRTASDPIFAIQTLWEFTQEYVAGVHELAKNIVEHSSYRKGVVTIRLYDREFNGDSTKLFETYVFDLGVKGVVQNLRETVSNYMTKHVVSMEDNDEEKKCYKEDYQRLKKDYHFADFLSPDYKKMLSHQVRRDIAHYGLMNFIGLVRDNGGDVFASSVDSQSSARDCYLNGRDISSVRDIVTGTFYFFRFPIRTYGKITSGFYSIGMPHASYDMSLSFDKMLRLKVVSTVTEGEESPGDYLLNIQLKDCYLKSREDEAKVKQQLESLPGKWDRGGRLKYVAINFACIEMTSSHLLRILAFISYRTEIPVIAYNVESRVFLAMVRDNRRYYNNMLGLQDKIPYWYKGHAVLVYSYLPDKQFYFADILTGNSELDFFRINKLVSRSFPNATSVINNPDIDNSNEITISGNVSTFFQNSILNPFDIMLKGVNGKQDIFVCNLNTIINKKVYQDAE